MAKHCAILVFFGLIVLASAVPVPDYDDDGQEILKGRDTRYYNGLPLFWFRRPLTGDDSDDYGSNGGGYSRPSRNRRRPAIPNYASVGAGWGR